MKHGSSHIAFYCALAIAGALTSHGVAQGYSPDFSNPSIFTAGQTLSGQDSWDTNNYLPGFGQSDSVGFVPGYSSSSSDNWGLLGGGTNTPPVVPTSYLFRQLSLAGAPGSAFNVEFGIISSQTPQTNSDAFGWTVQNGTTDQLENGTASNLLQVAFVPDTNYPAGTRLTVLVYNSAGNQLPGSGAYDIYYNSPYNLSISASLTGTVAVSLVDALGNPAVQIVDNQPDAGLTPDAITDVAATWTLADTSDQDGNGEYTNYGSNSLVFNNYSVTPEPSTGLLMAFGFLGLLARRRRA